MSQPASPNDLPGRRQPPPRVGVLVVNYLSAAAVTRLVQSLCNSRAPENLYISVVDNSEDDSEYAELTSALEEFSATLGGLCVTQAPKNLGYAAGNNLAYQDLPESVDVVLVANPDVVLTSGDLVAAAKSVESNPQLIHVASTHVEATVTSGRMTLSKFTGRSNSLRVEDQPPRSSIIYPGGHFLAMDRALWDKAQGFSEVFFLYSEELDLVLRLDLMGKPIPQLPGVVIAHESGLTTKTSDGNKSTTTHYHSTRSRIILFRRHQALRKYLPFVVISRLGWAMWTTVFDGWEAGRAVTAGLSAGLREDIESRYASVERQ